MSKNCKIYDIKKNVLFENSDVTVVIEGQDELDAFIKEAKEIVKNKTYALKSGKDTKQDSEKSKPSETKPEAAAPKAEEKKTVPSEKPKTRIGAGWMGKDSLGSRWYDEDDDLYPLYGI